MILAGVIFVATYILLLALPKHRALVALCGAAAFVVCGFLSPLEALRAVDWNVLLMIAGTMGLVELFIESGTPALLANKLLKHTHSVSAAIVALAAFAGLISAFIDNVATVLMVAPVALAVAADMCISPVPLLIAIAVSSNLQGAATLVGDTTSILLGGAAGMDFMDFFWYQGKPGIFWVVEAGAVASLLILVFLFRGKKESVKPGPKPVVSDWLPTVLLGGMVVLLASASFLPEKPALTNGLICTGLFLIGLARAAISGGWKEVKKAASSIDTDTLLLLAGVFIVVGGVQSAGLLDLVSSRFANIGGGNLFLVYTAVVWGSVICSAFIDNIPFVAAMLPVVAEVSSLMGVNPTVLYYGLLIGATLGGNLTPVGASANIAAIGILRRQGHEVKNTDFLRIGVPFTLAAVVTGYALIWLIWA